MKFDSLTNIKKIRLCLEKLLLTGPVNKEKLNGILNEVDLHYNSSDKKDS